jgi:hypothetical protein
MPKRKICDQDLEDDAAMVVKRPKTEDPRYVRDFCGYLEDIPYAQFLRFLQWEISKINLNVEEKTVEEFAEFLLRMEVSPQKKN